MKTLIAALKGVVHFVYEYLFIIIPISMLIIIIVGGSMSSTNRRKADKVRALICHPYSVLTNYTHDNLDYVVCGNKEIREVVHENTEKDI